MVAAEPITLYQSRARLVKKGMGADDSINGENPIRLASRASKLALAQTREVVEGLAPRPCRIEALSTRGDEVQDRSLAEIGGKGLFVKALEAALVDGRADAAVHSAKDMESDFAEGTAIAAFLEREDRRDALVGPHGAVEALPEGAVVGTSSVRRTAMLRSLRPDLEVRMLRGNVDSRLRQLSEGRFDAIVLAVAGVKRLGVEAEMHPLDEVVMLPAAGQGAIAVQALEPEGGGRRQAVMEALRALDHGPTSMELRAERACVAALDGTCRTPIGASARFDGGLKLKAALYSHDGGKAFFAEGEADGLDPEELGRRLARDLLGQAGGRAFLSGNGR